MSRSRIAPGVLALLGMAGLIGCAPTDPFNRQAVSGSVKYKGTPIVIGSVSLQPESPSGPTNLSLGITEGKFSAPRDKGLAPGKYLVRVTGYDKISKGPAPGSNEPMPEPAKQIVPAKYNTASNTYVEVKDGGPNTFDLNLE